MVFGGNVGIGNRQRVTHNRSGCLRPSPMRPCKVQRTTGTPLRRIRDSGDEVEEGVCVSHHKRLFRWFVAVRPGLRTDSR